MELTTMPCDHSSLGTHFYLAEIDHEVLTKEHRPTIGFPPNPNNITQQSASFPKKAIRRSQSTERFEIKDINLGQPLRQAVKQEDIETYKDVTANATAINNERKEIIKQFCELNN